MAEAYEQYKILARYQMGNFTAKERELIRDRAQEASEEFLDAADNARDQKEKSYEDWEKSFNALMKREERDRRNGTGTKEARGRRREEILRLKPSSEQAYLKGFGMPIGPGGKYVPSALHIPPIASTQMLEQFMGTTIWTEAEAAKHGGRNAMYNKLKTDYSTISALKTDQPHQPAFWRAKAEDKVHTERRQRIYNRDDALAKKLWQAHYTDIQGSQARMAEARLNEKLCFGAAARARARARAGAGSKFLGREQGWIPSRPRTGASSCTAGCRGARLGEAT